VLAVFEGYNPRRVPWMAVLGLVFFKHPVNDALYFMILLFIGAPDKFAAVKSMRLRVVIPPTPPLKRCDDLSLST